MLTKISTSVYLDFIFDEKPHWKMQKHGVFRVFPEIGRKNGQN